MAPATGTRAGPHVAPSFSVCNRRKEITMTTRHVRSALAASMLTFGMVALAPATGRAQNSTTLPDEGQMITLTGCFTQGVIGNSSKERFVLAKPFVGTVASV